jgi:hypothetical protein
MKYPKQTPRERLIAALLEKKPPAPSRADAWSNVMLEN